MKKIEIPYDIWQELNKLRKKHKISIKEQVKRALFEYILIQKETDYLTERGSSVNP